MPYFKARMIERREYQRQYVVEADNEAEARRKLEAGDTYKEVGTVHSVLERTIDGPIESALVRKPPERVRDAGNTGDSILVDVRVSRFRWYTLRYDVDGNPTNEQRLRDTFRSADLREADALARRIAAVRAQERAAKE